MADHQTVQDKSFVKDFTFNLLPAPLYDPGTTLLMADNGSGSEVIIEGRFWNFQKPKNDGLTSWEYLIRGRDDERISEYLLRSKVVKVLSGHGCEVKSKPAQQIEQAVQKDATAPPLAESRVEKHGSGNNSNILLEKASKCTNDAVDLFKRAAAHKRSAAELERDEADKIGAQMQDLVQERVQLEQKLADLKAREDVFATKKSELTDRADKLIKEVEGMESWQETGTSQSVAAESSIEDNHAAKRHRSE